MPLNKACSLDALEENIATEIRAGRPRAQAVAIAHRTLRDGCREAGQPVPARKVDEEFREAVEKRERSREYLEEVLARARRALNPRDFAVLFQAARGSAGGKVSAKRRREACAAPVEKGFHTGSGDGGAHAHGLDRRNGKTTLDGGHKHVWILPGTADRITSYEGGEHAHGIGESGNMAEAGGEHSHKIMLPDGEIVETKLGGGHGHGLMVETTMLDGMHTHRLVLRDGTEIQSLTPAEIVNTDGFMPPAIPLPPASEIVEALHELREERYRAAAGSELPSTLPDLDAAVELAIKGEAIPPPVLTVEAPGDLPSIGAEEGDLIDVTIDGAVVGLSKSAEAVGAEEAERLAAHWALIERHTAQIPFAGPEGAKLMFVVAAPTELELARKRALVGEDAITFQRLYLDPLGLSRSDVAVGFAMPVLPLDAPDVSECSRWSDRLVEAMKAYPKARVVALGKVAKAILKSAGVKAFVLPHPAPVRRRGDSGEVGRKIQAIAKALDVRAPVVSKIEGKQGGPPIEGGTGPAILADAISELRKTGQAVCRVVKTAEDKQIVYGVVLDPYVVDLQTEWVPPAEIESTAHGFLKKSRVIGFEHSTRADAQIVESWVEPYPSREDYRAAMDNRPHRAYTRRFGDDVIHSGTWVAGVQLGDHEWELHRQGKLNAFSVGGFSFKSRVTTAAMPEVEFVELIS